MNKIKIPINSSKALTSFLNSSSSFEVIYHYNLNQESTTGTSTKYGGENKGSSSSRLCILDSSFNPPHIGHSSLIKKCVSYYNGQGSAPKQGSGTGTGKGLDISVMLLLSVKNADKIDPKPAKFEQRIDMMCLMAKEISKEIGQDISVALSKDAKFADKAESIKQYQRKQQTYIVGYDTLIRIFDSKYYKPIGITESLNQFMQNCELFVVTRGKEGEGEEGQMNYKDRIAKGELEGIPREWATRINLVQGDEQILDISSSSIRSTLNREHLYPEIFEYITANQLYKEE